MNRGRAIGLSMGITALAATFAPGAIATGHAAVSLVYASGGTNQNGFGAPNELPSSGGLGEPTLIHDSQNRLFVTAPQAIGNVNSAGGSPMWTSTDLGTTFSTPIRSQACTAVSGGDTDLVADSNDNIYQTDLYLANSCLSVSEDHGTTFTAGNPYGTGIQPGDDRPWLAYNAISNQNYATYDGFDAVHVANTGPIANPAAGITMVQDVAAVPESALSGSAVPGGTRQCVCPPGGIAADNSAGPHTGRVYVSFSYQTGIAIAYTDLVGTCPNCTASPTWSAPIAIPDSASGSAFQDEWNFAPIKVDSAGTVYLMWAHAASYDGGTRLASGSVVEQYAYSTDGGSTWSTPVTLSTESGTTTFPTMDVVSPGVIDAAWYGTTATGDPNAVAGDSVWNVYYTRVTGANTTTPTVDAPAIAVAGIHNGCIQTGGGGSCPDRSLLDFFQLADTTDGVPNIVYVVGDVNSGVNVWFTRLATPGPGLPEAPLTALLVPAAAGAIIAVRRRRRPGVDAIG